MDGGLVAGRGGALAWAKLAYMRAFAGAASTVAAGSGLLAWSSLGGCLLAASHGAAAAPAAHGFRHTANGIRAAVAVVSWFDRHLKASAAAPAAQP
jgi:hypothetical protein